jgi:hypothetical protein
MMSVRNAVGMFAVGLITLAYSACTPDSSAQNRVLLNGHWTILKAFRNQKQTETLDGVYFTFTETNKMITNLPVGPELMTDFEFNKNVIQQKGNKVLEYHIDQINDSILVLGIELRGMPFELQLRRAAVPAEVPVTVQDTTVLR